MAKPNYSFSITAVIHEIEYKKAAKLYIYISGTSTNTLEYRG